MSNNLAEQFRKSKINSLKEKVYKVASMLTKCFGFNINTQGSLDDIVISMKNGLPIDNKELANNIDVLNKTCDKICDIMNLDCKNLQIEDKCKSISQKFLEEAKTVENDYENGISSVNKIIENLEYLKTAKPNLSEFAKTFNSKLSHTKNKEEFEEIQILKHINKYFENEKPKPKNALSNIFNMILQYSTLINKTVNYGISVSHELSKLKNIIKSEDPVNVIYKKFSINPDNVKDNTNEFLRNILNKNSDKVIFTNVEEVKHKDLIEKSEEKFAKTIENFVLSFKDLLEKLTEAISAIVHGVKTGKLVALSEYKTLAQILLTDLQISDFRQYYAIVKANESFEFVQLRESYLSKLRNLHGSLNNILEKTGNNPAVSNAVNIMKDIFDLIFSYQRTFLEIRGGDTNVEQLHSLVDTGKQFAETGKNIFNNLKNKFMKGSYETVENLLESSRKSTLPNLKYFGDELSKAVNIGMVKKKYNQLLQFHERNASTSNKIKKEGIENARKNLNKTFGDGDFSINGNVFTFKGGNSYAILDSFRDSPPDVQRKMVEAKYLGLTSLLDIMENLDTFLANMTKELLKNPETISALLLENLFKVTTQIADSLMIPGSDFLPALGAYALFGDGNTRMPYYALVADPINDPNFIFGGPYYHTNFDSEHTPLNTQLLNMFVPPQNFYINFIPIVRQQVGLPANIIITGHATNVEKWSTCEDMFLYKSNKKFDEEFLIKRFNAVKTKMDKTDIKPLIELFSELAKATNNESLFNELFISPSDLYAKYLNYLAFKDVIVFGEYRWPRGYPGMFMNGNVVDYATIPGHDYFGVMKNNNVNFSLRNYILANPNERERNYPTNLPVPNLDHPAMFSVSPNAYFEDGILQNPVIGGTDFANLSRSFIYSLTSGICALIDNFNIFNNITPQSYGLRLGVIRPIIGGAIEPVENMDLNNMKAELIEVYVRAPLLIKLYNSIFTRVGMGNIFEIKERNPNEKIIFSEMRVEDGMSSFYRSCLNESKSIKDTRIIVNICNRLASDIDKNEDVCYEVLKKIVADVCSKIGYNYRDKYALEIIRPNIVVNDSVKLFSSKKSMDFNNENKIVIKNRNENFASSDRNITNEIYNLLKEVSDKLEAFAPSGSSFKKAVEQTNSINNFINNVKLKFSNTGSENKGKFLQRILNNNRWFDKNFSTQIAEVEFRDFPLELTNWLFETNKNIRQGLFPLVSRFTMFYAFLDKYAAPASAKNFKPLKLSFSVYNDTISVVRALGGGATRLPIGSLLDNNIVSYTIPYLLAKHCPDFLRYVIHVASSKGSKTRIKELFRMYPENKILTNILIKGATGITMDISPQPKDIVFIPNFTGKGEYTGGYQDYSGIGYNRSTWMSLPDDSPLPIAGNFPSEYDDQNGKVIYVDRFDILYKKLMFVFRVINDILTKADYREGAKIFRMTVNCPRSGGVSCGLSAEQARQIFNIFLFINGLRNPSYFNLKSAIKYDDTHPAVFADISDIKLAEGNASHTSSGQAFEQENTLPDDISVDDIEAAILPIIRLAYEEVFVLNSLYTSFTQRQRNQIMDILQNPGRLLEALCRNEPERIITTITIMIGQSEYASGGGDKFLLTHVISRLLRVLRDITLIRYQKEVSLQSYLDLMPIITINAVMLEKVFNKLTTMVYEAPVLPVLPNAILTGLHGGLYRKWQLRNQQRYDLMGLKTYGTIPPEKHVKNIKFMPVALLHMSDHKQTNYANTIKKDPEPFIYEDIIIKYRELVYNPLAYVNKKVLNKLSNGFISRRFDKLIEDLNTLYKDQVKQENENIYGVHKKTKELPGFYGPEYKTQKRMLKKTMGVDGTNKKINMNYYPNTEKLENELNNLKIIRMKFFQDYEKTEGNKFYADNNYYTTESNKIAHWRRIIENHKYSNPTFYKTLLDNSEIYINMTEKDLISEQEKATKQNFLRINLMTLIDLNKIYKTIPNLLTPQQKQIVDNKIQLLEQANKIYESDQEQAFKLFVAAIGVVGGAATQPDLYQAASRFLCRQLHAVGQNFIYKGRSYNIAEEFLELIRRLTIYDKLLKRFKGNVSHKNSDGHLLDMEAFRSIHFRFYDIFETLYLLNDVNNFSKFYIDNGRFHMDITGFGEKMETFLAGIKSLDTNNNRYDETIKNIMKEVSDKTEVKKFVNMINGLFVEANIPTNYAIVNQVAFDATQTYNLLYGNAADFLAFRDFIYEDYCNNYKQEELVWQFKKLFSKFLKKTSIKVNHLSIKSDEIYRIFYFKIVEPLMEGNKSFDFGENKNAYIDPVLFNVIKTSIFHSSEKPGATIMVSKKYVEENYSMLSESHKIKIQTFIYDFKIKFDDFYNKVMFFNELLLLMKTVAAHRPININTNLTLLKNTVFQYKNIIDSIIKEINETVIVGEYERNFIKVIERVGTDQPLLSNFCLISALSVYNNNDFFYAIRGMFLDKTDDKNMRGIFTMGEQFNSDNTSKFSKEDLLAISVYIKSIFSSIYMVTHQPNNTLGLVNQATLENYKVNNPARFLDLIRMRYALTPERKKLVRNAAYLIFTPLIGSPLRSISDVIATRVLSMHNLTLKVLIENKYSNSINYYLDILGLNINQSEDRLLIGNIVQKNLMIINLNHLYNSVLFPNIMSYGSMTHFMGKSLGKIGVQIFSVLYQKVSQGFDQGSVTTNKYITLISAFLNSTLTPSSSNINNTIISNLASRNSNLIPQFPNNTINAINSPPYHNAVNP